MEVLGRDGVNWSRHGTTYTLAHLVVNAGLWPNELNKRSESHHVVSIRSNRAHPAFSVDSRWFVLI